MEACAESSRLRCGRFWERIGKPRYVLAPMVDQSEQSFRVLCKRHGANLAVTPMFSARSFVQKNYREQHFGPHEGMHPDDRPLLVQFAANDAQTLLAAAKHVEGQCDGVDINLGCPQKIAKRGHFGAFLLEEWPLLREMVGTLHCHLDVPVTCKIRLLWSEQQTIELARQLQDAGASLLTVHGRTREQKGRETGGVDWDGIRTVKSAVSIPVLANGGIETISDADRCIAHTGCDGAMLAEAALENPSVFEGHVTGDDQESLCFEYLALQDQFPADHRTVKQHLFTMLYGGLQSNPDLRGRLHHARGLEQMEAIVRELRGRPRTRLGPHCNRPGSEYTSWYHRHRWEVWKHPQGRGHNVSKASAVAEWVAKGESQGQGCGGGGIGESDNDFVMEPLFD
jgi:tRNA-dihydrouridine synthase 1|tara:strand:+ start:78 stop:1268 length:1191 start_codon:yes stop_codon:yes gene_type:complete